MAHAAALVPGEYLAAGKPLNTQVRSAFIKTFDFTGSSFVEALRVYMRAFRLPGESMLIERLIAVFSRKFYTDNPATFSQQLTAEHIKELQEVHASFEKKDGDGHVALADLGDLIHSMGGDLKYLKAPEVLHWGRLSSHANHVSRETTIDCRLLPTFSDGDLAIL